MSYEDILDEEPQSREEAYLKYIAENMGQGEESVTHIRDEVDIGTVLDYPEGLYLFDKWVEVDMTGTPWEESGSWGFEGLCRIVKDVDRSGRTFVDIYYYEECNYLRFVDKQLTSHHESLVWVSPTYEDAQGGLECEVTPYESVLKIKKASDSDIQTRNTSPRPIVPSNLDTAVKAALCDGKGAAWTEAEKQAAKNRMGISGGSDVPTVTIELSQIISEFPPKATVTSEQLEILQNNFIVKFDLTQIGNGIIQAYKSDTDSSHFVAFRMRSGDFMSHDLYAFDVYVDAGSECVWLLYYSSEGEVATMLNNIVGTGLAILDNNELRVDYTTYINLKNRPSNYVLMANQIDYAVMFALTTDGMFEWDEDMQKKAQQKLGILSSEGVNF